MASIVRSAAVSDDHPDLTLVAESADVDSDAARIDVERDVVVRLTPEIRWVAAQAVYLGPAEPRIVLDVAPWDEE